MLAALEQILIPYLEHLYLTIGYAGVAVAMAVESAGIPLPSEVILPMAGWMVARGAFNFWAATVAATVGGVVGSCIAYAVGAYGGRPLIRTYGRYVLISEHDLDVADRWFSQRGEVAIFLSRLLPVIRTFISLPAGIARMNFGRFVLYTTLGSLPWSIALIYAGKLLGDNWVAVRVVLQKFDYVFGALIIVAIAYYVYRHITHLTASVDQRREG